MLLLGEDPEDFNENPAGTLEECKEKEEEPIVKKRRKFGLNLKNKFLRRGKKQENKEGVPSSFLQFNSHQLSEFGKDERPLQKMEIIDVDAMDQKKADLAHDPTRHVSWKSNSVIVDQSSYLPVGNTSIMSKASRLESKTFN